MRNQLVVLTAVAAVLCVSTGADADVVISSDATQNMVCAAGACAPTAADAVLNVDDLESLLASGDVEVTTTGSGIQANNIDVTSALTWSSNNTLAIDAHNSVVIRAEISTTGVGNLSITTNDLGSGGILSFEPNGKATFQNLSSLLTINGNSYSLVNNITALADAISNNPDGYFALANNYDASVDGPYSLAPINTEFYGSFEGLGNEISNLEIHHTGSPAYIGLFEVIAGTVRDLKLESAEVYVDVKRPRKAIYSVVGVLAAGNAGTVTAVDVNGKVENRGKVPLKSFGAGATGGLVGYNSGTIASASARVAVKGPLAGGLVGQNGGNITLSSAYGKVTGEGNGALGGFAGGNAYGGYIDQSFATGSVSGGSNPDLQFAGGFIGYNTITYYSDSATANNCYATGNVSSLQAFAGGFSGSSGNLDEDEWGTLENSYSTGSASGAAGGFVGRIGGIFENAYWDTTTSGTDEGTASGNEPGITGLTTRQLRTALPTGFDPAIWAQDKKINNGLPYLINNPPGKKGT